MKLKKKFVVPTLAAALIATASIAGISVAHADDSGTYTSIVQRLAQRFNLNESDVQQVFDQARTEHQAQMQQNFSDRLEKAVTDGVITEDQKNVLMQKFEEKQNEKEQNRQDMQNWLKDQGIDMTKLGSYIGFGPHGMGHWHDMGN